MPKKKRKQKDPLYSKRNKGGKRRSNQSTHHGNLFAMRADTRKVLTDENGNSFNVKTACVIDADFLKENDYDEEAFMENLEEQFKTLALDRPILAIKQDSHGSPIELTTPTHQTVLKRERKIGPLSLFSNRKMEAEPTLKKLPKNDPFYDSAEFKAVKKIKKKVKKKSVRVNQALLDKTRKEKAKYENQRPISQNQVMVESGQTAASGSATKYAQATGLFHDTTKNEWGHMLSYGVLGPTSQDDGNLVCITKEMNTMMLTVETEYSYLAKELSTFDLQASAQLIPNTHIAKKVELDIKSAKFNLNLNFSGSQIEPPHVSAQGYFKGFLKTAVKTNKKTNQKNKENVALPIRLFNKKKPKVANIEPPSFTTLENQKS